jgi:hypothetical protein
VERKEDKKATSTAAAASSSEKKGATPTTRASAPTAALSTGSGGTPARTGASGNLASVDEGAAVIVATSSDPRHPPSAIIDGLVTIISYHISSVMFIMSMYVRIQ